MRLAREPARSARHCWDSDAKYVANLVRFDVHRPKRGDSDAQNFLHLGAVERSILRTPLYREPASAKSNAEGPLIGSEGIKMATEVTCRVCTLLRAHVATMP
jgi:hypothetical protein